MPRLFLSSLRHAFRGLRTVMSEERNCKIHLMAAALALVVSVALEFTFLEIALIVLAILLVLGSEIVNTLIEDLLNKVEPKRDPVVGKLKDMMAGMVLLNSVGALLIGALTLLHHFGVQY